MARTLFFAVTETDIGDGVMGYVIGTKSIAKTEFVQVATHNSQAVVLYIASTDTEYNYAKTTDEYLGDSYQGMVLDSLFGFSNELVAKKCMNVTYTDPNDGETQLTTTVYQWELDGFPGQGTHTYSKAVKILGVDVE